MNDNVCNKSTNKFPSPRCAANSGASINNSDLVQPGDRMLRIKEVCVRTGLCRSSVYALAAQGRFVRPTKLGLRSSGFLESQVTQWMQERVNAAQSGSALQ